MIPAWKRLGLKLKFAKEEPDFPGGSASPRNGHMNGEETEIQRPAKRQRTYDAKVKLNVHDLHDSSPSTRQPKRKKSVSFTEDTKTEDGDSRITIDFLVDSSGSTSNKALSEAQQPGSKEEIIEQQTPDAVPAPSARERGKKPKSPQGSVSNVSTRKSKDALDYLNQHHTNRIIWKYNKNRDIWIIKHALSTEAIPAGYNRALAGYIHGLPSKAGARLRLIEKCREALPETTLRATNEHHEQLLRHNLNSTTVDEGEADYVLWLSQIPRPQLVMLVLGDDISSTNGHVTDASIDSARPFVKKKKARTTAEVEISSSSESESDTSSESSDSSSDSDTSHDRTPAKNLSHDHSRSDSTSSSGSSTDSSDSD